MRIRVCLATLLALVAWSERGYAQGWSPDARKLALGNIGSNRQIASEMIEPDPKYRSIVIPLGLLQLIGNFDKFNPGSRDFDPVRAMEYVAYLYHITFGRDESSPGQQLVTDLFNQQLRPLSAYRGFVPTANPRAEGIASFSLIHKTFRIPTGGTTFQGIYVGVGPYFTEQTSIEIDQRLINFLDGASASGSPTAYLISVNRSTTQMAAALTFGYRAHMALPAGLPSAGTDREGIYLAVNYNYLHGFHLEDVGMNVRFDTSDGSTFAPNTSAQLAPCPADTTTPGGPYGTPFCTDRRTSSSGTGRAIDFGIATVTGPWEFGFGINGVANKMEWSDISREAYGLGAGATLTSGSVAFNKYSLAGQDNLTIEQPKSTRADVTYHAPIATFMGEVGSGYLGTSFSGGVEKTFEPLAARGGMHYSNEKWNPSTGVGMNIFPRVGIDVAFLTSTANAEKERNPVLALSIRINAGS